MSCIGGELVIHDSESNIVAKSSDFTAYLDDSQSVKVVFAAKEDYIVTITKMNGKSKSWSISMDCHPDIPYDISGRKLLDQRESTQRNEEKNEVEIMTEVGKEEGDGVIHEKVSISLGEFVLLNLWALLFVSLCVNVFVVAYCIRIRAKRRTVEEVHTPYQSEDKNAVAWVRYP